MKKVILFALPVVAFSIMAFAASPDTGVNKISETPLYHVNRVNTIVAADRQFIKEQIARAYNMDPNEIPTGMQFEMLHTAKGVEIFKREIDIIDFEEILWRENAACVNQYGEAIANVLRRYE
jgi:hypothetical protein